MDKTYTIIKDTREKNGYEFEAFAYGFKSCAGYVDEVLKTGDYSVRGLEDQVCIERKASATELAVNLGADKARFMAEIERMKDFPYKYLLLECSMNDVLVFPDRSSVPVSRRSQVRVRGPYLFKMLTDIQTKHGIPVLFCGDKKHGQIMCNNLLKRVVEIYSGE